VTEEEILEVVRETMCSSFEIDPAAVTLESKLYDDLALDSIDAIEVSSKLVAVLGRKLSDDELRSIRTVGDVVAIVARVRKNGG
jgi:acyl carrier protein